MKKLHKLLVQVFAGPLVMTFFIALFVLIMQFLFRHIDDLVGKGLEVSVIAELLFYATAGLIPMALPLAVLLASLMTFGNLGEHYELTAMKSSGISLLRIMYPLIILVAALTIGALAFSNYVLPKANLKTGALLYDIKHLRPELNIKVGAFNNDLEGYTIRAEDKNRETGTFYNFMIYDHTEGRGNARVTVSDSAILRVTADERSLIVDLYNGHGYEEIKEEGRRKSHPMRRNSFEQERIIFGLTGFDLERTDEGLFRHNYQMLNIKELSAAVDSLRDEKERRKERFAISLMRTNIFRNEDKMAYADTAARDSIYAHYQTIETGETMPLDTLLAGMTPLQRQQNIDIARNHAKASSSYIESSGKSLDKRQERITKHLIELNRKFTLSFACFIFFLIGAPLGAIIRRGGLGLPTVVSILFFILYYVISISGEKFAREGFIDAYTGMWISSIILLPLSVLLTYYALTDSSILRLSYYGDHIKKLFNRDAAAQS